MLTAAQPPYGLWPALFAGWPLLFLLVDGSPRPRAAAALGFWAGLGFFLTGVTWVGESFLIEAEKVWWYAPLMPLAMGAFATVLAAFWAGGFWLARRLWPGGWRAALALGGAMGLAELARGAALTGFPWALQAYAWIDAPPAQGLALVGADALSALTIAAAATPALLVRRSVAPALVAAAAATALWSWGAARLSDAPDPPQDAPVIRLVQPNIAQGDKWAPENRRAIFDSLLALTRAPVENRAPSLVIWPEVAVTFLFDESPEAIAEAVAATPEGAALALGAVRAERRDGARRLYNSLQLYDASGEPVWTYDKRRLTPFGEYVPYAWLLGRIGLGTLGDGLSGFAPGDVDGPLATPGLPPVAPLICYEIIFPRDAMRAAEGADWILQITNDAWFGDSAGPWQHLAQARARAIELGLPVARAANTGVSAMIDPYGRLRDPLALETRGTTDSRLPAPLDETLAKRLGPWTPLALVASLLLFVRLPSFQRRPPVD